MSISHSPTEKGFTLLEVLIALTIFSVIAAIPMGLINQTHYNKWSDQRNGAIAAAQQRLDELRLLDISEIPNSGYESSDVTIGAKTYQVVTWYCQNAAYCASANNRHINVEVHYLDQTLYSVQTVYTQLQ